MMTVVLALVVALFIGASVPGVVVAVRALEPVHALVRAGTKPWSCDICMCFWSTAAISSMLAATLDDAHVLLAVGPGYTLGLLLLRVVQAPASAAPPVDPPES